MRPNKQRILSSQPTKPGTGSHISLSRPTATRRAPSAVLTKHSFEKQPEFNLNDTVKNTNSKKYLMPSKLIQFEETTSTQLESRIINEMQRSYKFVSALSHINVNVSAKEGNQGQRTVRKSLCEVAKDEEVCNSTTDTCRVKAESVDLYFGVVSGKYWCKKCDKEVASEVRMNLPTLSV